VATSVEAKCNNKCQKKDARECQNKHVTSRRFTHGMALLLRAWQSSREKKYNIYMLADCKICCARSCMDITRSVGYVRVELREYA